MDTPKYSPNFKNTDNRLPGKIVIHSQPSFHATFTQIVLRQANRCLLAAIITQHTINQIYLFPNPSMPKFRTH